MTAIKRRFAALDPHTRVIVMFFAVVLAAVVAAVTLLASAELHAVLYEAF